MTLKATIPLDVVRVHLNDTEFADAAFAYTSVDLTAGGPGDVVTNITGLFDPAIDVEDDTVIQTGIEVVIANGTITRVQMAADVGDGLFEQGETVTAAGGATGVYVGQAAGVLYLSSVVGTFLADELVTGGTSAATWTTHAAAPAQAVEGIAAPKAGDTFVVRGYRWQVEAIDDEQIAGSFVITAQRGAAP